MKVFLGIVIAGIFAGIVHEIRENLIMDKIRAYFKAKLKRLDRKK